MLQFQPIYEYPCSAVARGKNITINIGVSKYPCCAVARKEKEKNIGVLKHPCCAIARRKKKKRKKIQVSQNMPVELLRERKKKKKKKGGCP